MFLTNNIWSYSKYDKDIEKRAQAKSISVVRKLESVNTTVVNYFPTTNFHLILASHHSKHFTCVDLLVSTTIL